MDSGGYNGDVSVIDKRRGDNSSQNGLVEYTIMPKPEIKAIFEEGGMPTPSFNQLKKNDSKAIDTFKNAIAKAKQSLGDNGASVELKDDYTDINLYLSEDGESGFGIKPNGDIVSVFSNNKAEGGRSHYMLEMATAEGGRQLDCFDIYLTKIYEAHGFKPVAKMKWNDEYIPDGWNKDNFKDYNNGEPALTAGRRHVVFMVYDPEGDIERKHKEHWNKYGDKYGDTEERNIPYVPEYDDGETFQHIHKWRSPAEREAIYNNMLERYKNAKTSEELKKTVFDNDAPLDVFNRLFDDLNSLNKEQAQGIKDEYDKRMLELLKEEDPEQYKAHKKYLEQKAKEKAKKEKEKTKADARIDTQHAGRSLQNYIDRAIQTPFINDLLILADAKREFDESKIKRDKDGRFAKKNESGNKDNDKIKDTDNDNGNSNDNINNKDNDSSKPKKSNCNIGDVIDIIFNTSRGQTTPAKKLKDSQDYELYEQNTEVFNKLKPQQQKAIEDAIDNVSKRYNELFNIYGLSDSQPTNKLKVVLLDEKYKKQLKETTGFVLDKGSKDENANNIFINTAKIKRLSQENISKFIMHETIHTIMNDNLRNRKFKKGASTILEEALAESSTFLTDGENYRAVDKNWTTEEKTRWLLKNEYNFTSNLMHYFYLKNNKNSDIFKDIVNNIQNNERGRFDQAIEDTGHKLGIEGEFNNIIEYWLQDEYKIDERIAKQFTTDLIFKIMKWGARI